MEAMTISFWARDSRASERCPDGGRIIKICQILPNINDIQCHKLYIISDR